jgi:hypothetical protein
VVQFLLPTDGFTYNQLARSHWEAVMSAARLVLFALVSAVLLVAGPALGKPAKAPSKLGGKAFVTGEAVKDQAPDALGRQFASAPPQSSLGRKANGHWTGTLVGFFKKPSVPGPLIIWVFDKADKQSLKDNEPVQAITVESTPRDTLVHEMDFDPDQGYNKEHVYVVRVGQIIQKKPKAYATGEVKLIK